MSTGNFRVINPINGHDVAYISNQVAAGAIDTSANSSSFIQNVVISALAFSLLSFVAAFFLCLRSLSRNKSEGSLIKIRSEEEKSVEVAFRSEQIGDSAFKLK